MNQNSNENSKIRLCVENIIQIIDGENRKINNRKLLEICSDSGNFREGAVNPHLCHEIAETAFNALIKGKYAGEPSNESNTPKAMLEILKSIAERLPSQTWRSREQNIWQQFSTPPAIAYLLAYLSNLKTSNQVLKPSAGKGSLAV